MFCESAEKKAGMGAKRPGPWGGFLPRASREGSSLLHSESVKRESLNYLAASGLERPEGKTEI